VVFKLATDHPKDADWLTDEQRAWLVERLACERAQREAVHTYSLGETFANPKMWLLTVTYFSQNVTGYGLVFFLPLIVKGLGVSTGLIGVVSALPFLCGFIAMLFWAYHSDITGDRIGHVVAACLLCAAGLGTCIFIGVGHPVVTMIALILAGVGSTCIVPVFWALPSAILTGTAAAGGLAMIGAIGNLGGWLGPTVYGLVKDATGSTDVGLLCLAAAPLISVVAVLLAGHDRRLERMSTRR
jgi:cyanate permease